MISYDRILNEMERQLDVAHRTSDEAEMREALSAIRSLCEVSLSGNAVKEEKVVPKMLSTSNIEPPTSLEGKPLQEKDANGGSIFDF